jgi:hypothetical protein
VYRMYGQNCIIHVVAYRPVGAHWGLVNMRCCDMEVSGSMLWYTMVC